MSSRRVSRRPAPAFRPKEVEGDLDASGLRFTVVCARRNPTVTDALLATALETLERCGARGDDVRVVRVPGAFELPGAARTALSGTPKPDAVIVLGAIVKGETTHHEVLGHAVAAALAALSGEKTGHPIGFGLLTCDTMDQARKRAGKGAEAAEAAIAMANLKRRRKKG